MTKIYNLVVLQSLVYIYQGISKISAISIHVSSVKLYSTAIHCVILIYTEIINLTKKAYVGYKWHMFFDRLSFYTTVLFIRTNRMIFIICFCAEILCLCI